MHDLKSLYFHMLLLFRKKKLQIDNNEVKRDIKKLSKLASSTLINQKALIKADFARKGMNIHKFHKEVMEDLADSSDSDDDQGKNPNVPTISEISNHSANFGAYGMP